MKNIVLIFRVSSWTRVFAGGRLGRALKRSRFILLFIAFIAVSPTATPAEIYKCIDEYGNVAYLQLPCPAESAEAAELNQDNAADVADPEQHQDTKESPPAPETPAEQVPSSRRPGELLDDCKKRYRDQIDEIDAEMRVAFSPEEGELFKEKLLALTRELRACG
jgi:hypothetical protein